MSKSKPGKTSKKNRQRAKPWRGLRGELKQAADGLVQAVDALPMAAAPVTRKLDLACGQSPREGFEGVDIWQGAKHVVDLLRFPWPFEDNSVAELHCSHFCEHIPMINVDPSGSPVTHGGQDLFLRFMDECYRILVPGGWMRVIVPSGRSNRAFQDPTHRRFFVETSFAYLAADWRLANKLDHYVVGCDFGINVQTTVDSVLNAKAPDIAQREMQNYWNSTVDFHAIMQAIKPARTQIPTQTTP